MSVEFLKKARKMDSEYVRQANARHNLTSLDINLDAFRRDYWPEILALVEAANDWQDGILDGTEKLEDALDALNKKAGDI